MSESANAAVPAEAAAIEQATRRLSAALESLEAAVEMRRHADSDEERLAARIQALGADRSRLTHELDGVIARSRSLERTNSDIAHRLDQAIATIRTVLDAREP